MKDLKTIVERELEAVEGEPTKAQLMEALMVATRELQGDLEPAPGDRKLYYFSAEFLMGRLLRANLINLGLIDEAEALLAEHGTTLAEVEEAEPEPSLGNGGLGRLAACFLDSIASLGLPGDGVGLNYHYGLFRQDLSHGIQEENADPWIAPQSWLVETGKSYPVNLRGQQLNAKLYDVQIPGYENGVCNQLHLFDVENPAEPPAKGIDFDKADLAGHLTSFLYPDDSDEAGRLLRVCQQYFMVSAGAQMILDELEARGHSLQELDQHVTIQINDTHPSMVIPELIRLLTERGVDFERAVYLVERTCNYTNHTILAEALEKWPVSYLEQVAPQIVPIIRRLDQIARTRTDNPELVIWDDTDTVHMARMDVHFASKVNGVAELHTEILETSTMKDFYDLYPEKFTNKTNGVTFRRWLMGCNEPLAELLDKTIGTDWRRDANALESLADHVDEEQLQNWFLGVKYHRKEALAQWLKSTQGVDVNPDAVFDIQIKRLHQYKRQQMNALYAIWKYKQIKAGHKPKRPLVMIFGAKAAPAYTLAKDTIHLLCLLSELFANDPEVAPYLQLVMVENYNVSAAEHLIPAADISEQISLASKEASGTSNMKLMANGAVTLGTMDGANVEIVERAGEENAYIFGRSSEDVIDLYATESYHPWDFWRDGEVRELVDFVVSPELLTMGDPEALSRLYKDFIADDYFMALLDVKDYISTKERCLADYEDRNAWARKALMNIARSGHFSSDRTIAEYDRDIWHLNPELGQ